MNTKEKKSHSVKNAPSLEIKGLWLMFHPHSPDLGNQDWFLKLQGEYDKDYDDLTEEQQENVQLAFHLRGSLCWKLSYISDGKQHTVGQVYYLDFDEEKEWQSKLKFGTYFLCGDEAPSYNNNRGGNTIEEVT